MYSHKLHLREEKLDLHLWDNFKIFLSKILQLDFVAPTRAAAIAVLWLYLQTLGEDPASGLAVV